jgi:hypothetical protein
MLSRFRYLTEHQVSAGKYMDVVLSNSNPEIQNLAVKLAEKFADPRFNDQWTQSAGYLPVRAIGQSLWQNDCFYEKMVTICENGD